MAPPRTIGILIVDDHPVTRTGLRSLIESAADMRVIGESSDGREAVTMCLAVKPDVTLMDLRMPRLSGAAAVAAIRAELPAARIIILTALVDDEDSALALQAGARGFLPKDTSREELWAAIRAVDAGGRWVSPALAARLAEQAADSGLTARERETLELIVRGRSNREIADALGLSESTVKAYLKVLFEKLDVTDRTQAAALALQRGLVKLE